MTGKARMNAYKDRIAARVERGAGDVPSEPRNRDPSKWRFDMRTHLAVTSEKPSTKRTE